jgi:DTW domain-containing protein YfiP
MDDGRPSRGKRVDRCAECRLPTGRCICVALPRVQVSTRVVVLMHRNERLKSSNTGGLAARVLTHAELLVRGLRDPARVELPAGRRLVLFPGSHAEELTSAHADGGTVLLVPDATWSQARKMVQRDELLASARPVRLPAMAPSRYLLRRGVREGTVCTFEAIACALGVLEGRGVEEAMLAIFDEFQSRNLEVRFPPVTSARRLRAAARLAQR